MKRLLPLLLLALLGPIAWLTLSPPQAWLDRVRRVEVTPAEGQRLVETYGCLDCHRIAGRGALKAPSLDGISQRLEGAEGEQVRRWIMNPKRIKKDTAMPRFRLSNTELEAILLYLASVDPQR
ncbi:MAG: cytochrome c [Caldilineales bacterium]|nr:cytochrome c [Caldilineales bacterium]